MIDVESISAYWCKTFLKSELGKLLQDTLSGEISGLTIHQWKKIGVGKDNPGSHSLKG